MKKYYLFILPLLLSLTIFSLIVASAPAYAQEFSYGQSYTISDEEAQFGDIIARNSEGQYVRANLELGNNLVGVLAEKVTVLYEGTENEGTPVVLTGTALVNVSTLNGEIVVGDTIVASPIDGVGQKAVNPNGIIVGIALAPFTENDGSELNFNEQTVRTGSVPAIVQLRPAGSTQAGALTNLVDQLANLLFTSAQTPQQAEVLFRYLAAAIVAATSIAISFRSFGGSITNGIEAMGRNPLARRQIQAAIFLNAGLILVISIGGIILSLAILRL